MRNVAPFITRLLLLGICLAALLGKVARGQELFIGDYSSKSVGAYNASNGLPVAGFTDPSGFKNPQGVAVSGTILYVADETGSSIGEYNAITGAPINANFITGLSGPTALAVSGSSLDVLYSFNSGFESFNATTGAYINSVFGGDPNGLVTSGSNVYVSFYDGGVSEYNAQTLVSVAPNLIPSSSLRNPYGLAISGTILYVASQYASEVGEFSAVTGATINADLINVTNVQQLAISGNDLYTTNSLNNVVGDYDVTTGSAVSGFTSSAGIPTSFATLAIPEPGVWEMTLAGLVLAFAAQWWRRRSEG
jgi:hypothetical protein